ncbi:hypothetical protein GS601_02740 [Myxacorys almedinensis A]|uniref:Uncharacterized protein n=2 Tax=Myxacorys TaxID=2056239 RepID=A0A8J7Z674_9CYAN|nr:hypothetical protein [Myxacorys almedinensis A]
MPIRVGAFALSLGLLVGVRQTGIKHPAKPWAIAVLCIMALELFWHPHLNSLPAGVAQCLMYLAILAPLFWVSRLPLNLNSLRGLVFLLWGFHTLSSGMGVLQTYYSDVFQFVLSTKIQAGVFGGDHLMIQLANGKMIHRPMGLTDIPGGAAKSGFYAVLLGTGIALQERRFIVRLMGIGSIPIGLFCIYLSQVRSILVSTLICLIVLAFTLLYQKRFLRLTALLGGMALGISVALSWALNIGGEATSDRLSSLFADRLDQVVYQNRGYFLEQTLTDLLSQYPLGAGLGRWGMINDYFGSTVNPLTAPIWVEIQWTGWLLDGGVPLILAYCGAIAMACYAVWAIMTNPTLKPLQLWASVVFAYNVGAIALTFNNSLFLSQSGMEFWLLNAVLFAVAHQLQKQQMGWFSGIKL